MVHDDQTTETVPSVKSFGVAVEDNIQINDQYVDLDAFDPAMDVRSIRSVDDVDDEKDPNQSLHSEHGDSAELRRTSPPEDRPAANSLTPKMDDGDPSAADREQDAVMISQTLTLKTRNAELERERDHLQSETLQLRMQTECLKQSNEHIIAAQQQEIQRLQSENHDLSSSVHDKDEQLKQVQAELARIQREKENLQKKLNDIVSHRGRSPAENAAASNMASSAVLVKEQRGAMVYGCIQCGQHLFDSSAMVQRQIEIDDHSFGLIVDCLFNVDDVTMGPTVCKTFLNGMFKARELYCDGCLGTFGWKIIESFDEWNAFHQNKYCIDIANIREVAMATL